jgi:hypothetical protein
MKIKIIINIAIISIVMLLPTFVHAQIDGLPNEPSEAPVDGGLSLLIAGGVGYGVKKLRAARKSK